MATKRRWIVVVHALALGLSAPAGALADEDTGYAANRFDPSEPGSDWYGTESLDLRGALLPRLGIVGDWSYGALERRGHRVLTDSVVAHVRGAVVLADRVRVGVSLPVTLFAHGDLSQPGPPLAPTHSQAVGDLRWTGDVRIFGSYETRVRAAAGLALWVPTGSRADFTSDGTVRATPRILVAGQLAAFAWAAKAGFGWRPLRSGSEAPFASGNDLSGGVSAGLKVNDRFVVGPELMGAVKVSGRDAWAPRGTYLELLLGGHIGIANDFQVGTAIGGGLTSGDGAPTLRVLATFEYAPDVCIDKDGDGICAYEDACPEADGVRTRDKKTNGCPADRDGDKIPDRVDQCPDAIGQPSIDPSTVGCPDRDGDGVADTLDACPDTPGVPQTNADQNGCPKPAAPGPPSD